MALSGIFDYSSFSTSQTKKGTGNIFKFQYFGTVFDNLWNLIPKVKFYHLSGYNDGR